MLGDDIEFEAVLKEIQNYENNENQTSINKNSVNQTSNESSVNLMNNNVTEVVTHHESEDDIQTVHQIRFRNFIFHKVLLFKTLIIQT